MRLPGWKQKRVCTLPTVTSTCPEALPQLKSVCLLTHSVLDKYSEEFAQTRCDTRAPVCVSSFKTHLTYARGGRDMHAECLSGLPASCGYFVLVRDSCIPVTSSRPRQNTAGATGCLKASIHSRMNSFTRPLSAQHQGPSRSLGMSAHRSCGSRSPRARRRSVRHP